ncbi:MAG: START domain-containing protein [Puia sp.]|nr:START domain-containing protein [Puia sp.]
MRIFLLFLLVMAGDRLIAQSDWSLKRDKDGIRVYSRSSDHSKFNEIRAEFSMHASLSELAAVMLDAEDHVQWQYSTKSSYLLQRVSESELYFYNEINAPWPVANRDLIVHLTITQNPATRVMTMAAVCTPGFSPVHPSIVRVPVSKAVWTVTPVTGDSLRVEYVMEIDPGGSVPAWLINMFATKGPYESFRNLRQQVLLPKYQQARLSFITN